MFQKFDWPHDFQELAERVNDYRIYTSSEHFFNHENSADVRFLGSQSKPFLKQDIVGMVLNMANMKTVLISRSTDIATIFGLFNPSKFTVLEEKFVMSQYVILVSKKFVYYNQTIKMYVYVDVIVCL